VSCAICEGTGIWPYVDTANPKPDSEITADDLLFAVCLCVAGRALRHRENCGRKVVPLWRVWCARHQVSTERVRRLEDVVTPEQLQEAGFSEPVLSMPSREAALLAAGKGKNR
jgi:hypothetical protein